MGQFPPVHTAALVLIAACLHALHWREQAPAELPKQAASFDLPITLGILAVSMQFQSELFDRYAVGGELALNRGTRPTKGALSIAMAAAKQEGLRGWQRQLGYRFAVRHERFSRRGKRLLPMRRPD